MAGKCKVKFLTVIWGDRYIEEFARVSLPSYLAAGNLPALAKETDLEVLVLTSKESPRKFEGEPIFTALRTLCPIRYIFIDDLITTGNYGVTLTLAYARGMRDSGQEQTNTHFVFMNSDFVLADGSLRTLVGKLREGHRCIMAPSLRASAETVLSLLIEAVDHASGTLSMSPRQMVQLTLDNLHPTAIAKTVTQHFVTCKTHNQIYWQVDENTLLGRYFLIFMLAIKPEVPIGQVNSYCDYGLVPELVPSGDFAILDDSDSFFMLELQSAAQEKQYLRCGTSTLDEIASELSIWTTREHRRFAEVDVVFRSGDPPPRLAQARAEMADYVAKVQRRMRTPPRSHVDHFYWALGVRAWLSLKFSEETEPLELPPELVVPVGDADTPSAAPAPHRLSIRQRVRKWFSYVEFLGHVRHLAGAVPNVPIWHHRWLDSRLILNWVEAMKAGPHQRNLLVCDENSTLPVGLRKLAPFEARVGLTHFLASTKDRSQRKNVEAYDNLLMHVYRANVRQTRRILETAEKYVKPGGTIAIYIDHVNGELDGSNFSHELAQYVDQVLPANWIGYRLNANFAGGMAKRRLRLAEIFLLRHLLPSSAWRLPHSAAAVALWPAVAALTALNNLRLRRDSANCPQYCSSALLTLSRSLATAVDVAATSRRLAMERVVGGDASPSVLPRWHAKLVRDRCR